MIIYCPRNRSRIIPPLFVSKAKCEEYMKECDSNGVNYGKRLEVDD
jgi:hypothetical protein